MDKLTGSIIALFTVVGFCFSIYFFVDSRYALAAELRKVEDRLEYKINKDDINAKQERIWKLEDKASEETSSAAKKALLNEKRKLEAEKEEIENKNKEMINQSSKGE